MPPLVYTCDVCGYITGRKSRMNYHNARKNPCKPGDFINQLVEKKVREVLASTSLSNELINTPPLPLTIKVTTPFLKWVGGKTQIIDEVMSLFPTTVKNYHEPFLGGGSVLLALLSYVKAGKITLSGKIYASDLNSNIINLYKAVQSNPTELINETTAIINPFTKIKGTTINRKPTTEEEANTSQESYYYWIRAKFNALTGNDRKTSKAAAMCLFLNKTDFRGMYRDGPNGFNVPFGHYKNPSIIDTEHINEISKIIKDVIFQVQPFSDSLQKVKKGDFVYLDPPYAPETGTSFVGYTGDGFGLDHHNLLFTSCKTMKVKGIKMLMSNANVKLVRDAFPSPAFQTKTISARRAINSKKPESTTTEVLITN